ncbi:MAG: hypothetical protein JNK68_05585 [Betaproteobacteria bacterium]|nr:hypothetical protein [Betaproteobacteria bacterium]
MCNAIATSREHAPPSCFFPSVDDVGIDLRKNLVTVPACDDHNSRKSKDDEFFRAVIVMTAAQHSEIGRVQFFGKFIRAVRRTPHAYRSFFEDHGTLAGRTQHASRIDRTRFDACVDHLARALFFHTYGTKWVFPIAITSPNFYSGVANDAIVPHLPTEQAVAMTRRVLGSQAVLGDNPDVFKYRLRYEPSEDAFAFAAIFYDVFEVFSYSSRELSQVAV